MTIPNRKHAYCDPLCRDCVRVLRRCEVIARQAVEREIVTLWSGIRAQFPQLNGSPAEDCYGQGGVNEFVAEHVQHWLFHRGTWIPAKKPRKAKMVRE